MARSPLRSTMIAARASAASAACAALMINGAAHGPRRLTTACQLHMREFSDGEELWIEPWRAAAFPVRRDLSVDRTALDRIIKLGGYVYVATGNAPDANAIPIGKEKIEITMEAAWRMVTQMDLKHFGGCTLFGECQEARPKGISIDTITRMNRDFAIAPLAAQPE